MTLASTLAGLLAAMLYSLTTLQFAKALRSGTQHTSRRALIPFALALACHAASLALTTQFSFALAPALSLTAWLMVATVFGLAFSMPVASLACVMAPIAGLFAVLTPLLETTVTSALEPGVWVHAVLSLCAYGLLGLSAVQACLVAWQTTQLRRTALSTAGALPPLESSERLMFSLMTAGVVALTVAIATGFAFLQDMFGQRVAHKTVFSLLAWVAFAALLVGHHVLGWRGKTALRWTLSGMGLLLVGFFGSKLVLEVILQPD
ncbi:MAG: cytochrome c biogenesis protein CcsA [Pseudomonadota bacterium]